MKPLLTTLLSAILVYSISGCSNPSQVDSTQTDAGDEIKASSTAETSPNNEVLDSINLDGLDNHATSSNATTPPSDQDLEDAKALLQGILVQDQDQGISTQTDTETTAPNAQQIPDFESTKELAEMGDYIAEFNLGLMYKNGDGVEQNYDKSFEWFMKVANKGIPEAQTNVGLMYKDGQGTDQSYAKAVEWFQQAAIQDYPLAQYNLGMMNMVGEGVAQNDAEAAEWFRKACDNGYPEGCSYYQEIIDRQIDE